MRHLLAQVPLLVRGPHIKANLSVGTISGNTDIAPTILDLAGGSGAVNPMMDGRSLLPLLLDPTRARLPEWERRVAASSEARCTPRKADESGEGAVHWACLSVRTLAPSQPNSR